jgi:bacterial surface protein 26-residue repeat protein (fragment)
MAKSAYVFRSAEDTLIFCYDADRESRNGDTWEIPEGKAKRQEIKWKDEAIRKVVINPSFSDYRPTSTSRWFYRLTNLTTIEGLEHLNTSEVTDMEGMFEKCDAITTLDLSNFDTSKVENMSGMFRLCKSLTNLDVSSFDVSAVEDMTFMFDGCESLEELDLSHFNPPLTAAKSDMYYNCHKLKVKGFSRIEYYSSND